MELKHNTYVLAVWFYDFPVGNIMMTVIKADKNIDKWTAEIRLRIYNDNKVFGSKDAKTFYDREWPEGTSQEVVLKDCHRLVELYSHAYKPTISDFFMVEGDGEKMMEIFKTKDWANAKKLDPDNEEDREELRKLGVDVDKLDKERRGVEKEEDIDNVDEEDNKEE